MSDDTKFTPRWFTVSIPVYPPIPMVQGSALALATNLAAKLSLTDIHMGDEVWEYRRPHQTEGQPRGLIRVVVEESEIKIEHQFPATGLEQFEHLVQQVLDSLPSEIAPAVAFGVLIELDYVLDLRMDSRLSLLTGLDLIDPTEGDPGSGKIGAFERPCHLVGLRLGFPPYAVKKREDQETELPDDSDQEDDSGADWEGRVTVLTVEDDPSKVSVEVSGRWHSPFQWSTIQEGIPHNITILESFLREKIVNFLEHFRADDGEDQHED